MKPLSLIALLLLAASCAPVTEVTQVHVTLAPPSLLSPPPGEAEPLDLRDAGGQLEVDVVNRRLELSASGLPGLGALEQKGYRYRLWVKGPGLPATLVAPLEVDDAGRVAFVALVRSRPLPLELIRGATVVLWPSDDELQAARARDEDGKEKGSSGWVLHGEVDESAPAAAVAGEPAASGHGH